MKPDRSFWRPATAVLALLIALAPSAATARAAKPKAKSKTPALTLPTPTVWELKNGLKVAYVGLHDAPVVTVQVWYHAGSKDEPAGHHGSAHMFEHMMFRGTAHVRPQDHAKLLNQLGGVVNATTDADFTYFYNLLPAAYLDFAVKLEAERMRNLLFRPKMIDTEREVVKEELRTALNNPIQAGLRTFFATEFSTHPYGWLPGGNIQDLDNTTPADLQKFYNTYYQPNNAMLVVVGDVSEDDVRAVADRYFGVIPAAAEPPRPAAKKAEPAQTKMRRVTAEPSRLGIVLAGYHTPAATSPDIYALQVLAMILGQGDSSRLHRRLVREEKMALQAGSNLLVREDPGLFLLLGVFLDPSHTAKVESLLGDEVAKVQKHGVTAKELSKAKKQLLSTFAFGTESVQGMAKEIGTSWVLTGDPSTYLSSSLQKIRAVTAADIKRVAQTYLKKENLTVVIIPVQGAAKTPTEGAK
ncbi:MAG TPA: pitrilysin family protein [Kofleriaceae bacterium]|nr:pitrilysin family protein [Kofleriaceae bacterium]